MKPKHPPVVYVEWVDAALLTGVWDGREELLKQAADNEPIVAAGFLLSDEERGIIVAAFYNGNNDDASAAMLIPRPQIIKMVVIRSGYGFTHDAHPREEEQGSPDAVEALNDQWDALVQQCVNGELTELQVIQHMNGIFEAEPS